MISVVADLRVAMRLRATTKVLEAVQAVGPVLAAMGTMKTALALTIWTGLSMGMTMKLSRISRGGELASQAANARILKPLKIRIVRFTGNIPALIRRPVRLLVVRMVPASAVWLHRP